MFGQTLDGGVIAALSSAFFMIVAMIALSWRPSRMGIRRGTIGGLSASLAWFIIGAESLFSGDGYGVAIGFLFAAAGAFCTYMAYREYRKEKTSLSGVVVTAVERSGE